MLCCDTIQTLQVQVPASVVTMKGLEYASRDLSKVRFRLSRLLELGRIPKVGGRKLLWKVAEACDLAAELERSPNNGNSN